jgi:hypothetical protein
MKFLYLRVTDVSTTYISNESFYITTDMYVTFSPAPFLWIKIFDHTSLQSNLSFACSMILLANLWKQMTVVGYKLLTNGQIFIDYTIQ